MFSIHLSLMSRFSFVDSEEIQLTSVTIQVENTLRGSVAGPNVRFYFFGFADENVFYIGPSDTKFLWGIDDFFS